MSDASGRALAGRVSDEAMAVFSRLADAVGHELRNPLGVITNSVYYLRMVLPEDERYRKHLDILQREVSTAARIVAELVEVARVAPPSPAPTDLNALVRRVVDRVARPPAVQLGVELEPAGPVLRVDPDQVELALGHLVANALEAMPAGGTLTVRTARGPRGDTVSVADTGVGIPPEHLDRIFEPLFTTKPRCLGLGLTVARALAEANGARVQVESAPGRGSRFDLCFPRPEARERGRPGADAAPGEA
ncbi:MAG TPA: ATP-binding protein [Methylomirabilota bacterium]|nr:ATP-binding protein [Methylomirabilota bacterium]